MNKLFMAIIALCIASSVYAQTPSMRVDGGYRITPVADVLVSSSATLVQAADGSRVSLSCTNTDTSVHARWGSSAVTATTGQQFRAGTSIEIRNTGAIYMISEGADITVACTKETY